MLSFSLALINWLGDSMCLFLILLVINGTGTVRLTCVVSFLLSFTRSWHLCLENKQKKKKKPNFKIRLECNNLVAVHTVFHFSDTKLTRTKSLDYICISGISSDQSLMRNGSWLLYLTICMDMYVYLYIYIYYEIKFGSAALSDIFFPPNNIFSQFPNDWSEKVSPVQLIYTYLFFFLLQSPCLVKCEKKRKIFKFPSVHELIQKYTYIYQG